MKTYVILSTKHKSVFGYEWCLFHSKTGYVSDIRLAERYSEIEIEKFKADTDYPIDVEILGVSNTWIESVSGSVRCLIEKGTVNQLCGLNLKIGE